MEVDLGGVVETYLFLDSWRTFLLYEFNSMEYRNTQPSRRMKSCAACSLLPISAAVNNNTYLRYVHVSLQGYGGTEQRLT